MKKELSQATYRYAKANNKYMKNHDKNKESTYLEYLDANNLYGWVMPEKLPVRNYKLIEKVWQAYIYYTKYKKICSTHKSFKAGTKSWIIINKGT